MKFQSLCKIYLSITREPHLQSISVWVLLESLLNTLFISSMKVAFSFIVFGILLFQEKSVFSHAQQITGRKKANFTVRNQTNSPVNQVNSHI